LFVSNCSIVLALSLFSIYSVGTRFIFFGGAPDLLLSGVDNPSAEGNLP
jgi:hypothetical protein